MRSSPSDPSVRAEPHLGDERPEPDASESRAAQTLAQEKPADVLEHTVWDEPGLSPELAGQTAQGQLHYAGWLEQGRRSVGTRKSWALTLGIALMAGPWAVLGALWSGGGSVLALLAVVVFGPLAEEVLKISAALAVVERRPYYFRSAFQIAVCALASGLMFATLENLLYLHVYVPDPSPALVRWRWSVCVALHMGCSAIAGLGVVRIWRDVWTRRSRPALHLGLAYTVVAAVVHGTYNLLATVLEFFGGPF